MRAFPRGSMKLRTIGRWALWTAAGVAAILVLAYLFRWPLLEGRIRREIAQLAGDQLQVDVSVGRLHGNLLSSIRVEGLELRPRPGSPIRAGAARSATVHYGFLGSGRVEIDAKGLDVSIAAHSGPSSVPQTIREVFPVLRSIRDRKST